MARSMVNMQVDCIPPGQPRCTQLSLLGPQPFFPLTKTEKKDLSKSGLRIAGTSEERNQTRSR